MKNKFIQLTALVLAMFGKDQFAKNKDGKSYLSEEEKTELAKMTNEEFASNFTEALQQEATGEAVDDAKVSAMISSLSDRVKQNASTITHLNTQFEDTKTALQAEKEETAKMLKIVKEQEKTIEALNKSSETDPPARGAGSDDPKKRWLPTGKDTNLFGQNHSFTAIDDAHPYNQRAYQALCKMNGIMVPAREATVADYAQLKTDLGDFYRTRMMDQVQSFLRSLPSLTAIFPLYSNIQDQSALTNVFFTEFSQAANPGSKFANLVKGSYKFQPEIIKMYPVILAHMFEEMEALEKTWIGYLNREGSDFMKWSFIEFILTEVGKKIRNEQEIRRIKGVFKTPTKDVPGSFINASDGLLKRMKLWIAENKIRQFPVGEWNSGNICTYVKNCTSLIPEVLRSSGNLVLYMSKDAWADYLANHELLHGLNQDYVGGINYVKEYPNVKIVTIPGMAPSKRMIWTFDGNIFLAEDKPGEYLAFNLEQQDWTLKVWTRAKESVWAFQVGEKFDTPEQIPTDYSSQMIWCNDVDEPSDYFISMNVDDATPTVIDHTSLVSVANTQATAITNILDAPVGRPIKLKYGNDTNGVTIAKAGNFSLIASAWTGHSIGDTITLVKRSDGKFLELARTTLTSAAVALADGATSIDASTGTSFVTVANTAATVLLGLTNAVVGTVYTIYGGSNAHSTTMANAGNFILTDAMTLSLISFISLVKNSDGKFCEISRG